MKGQVYETEPAAPDQFFDPVSVEKVSAAQGLLFIWHADFVVFSATKDILSSLQFNRNTVFTNAI